MTRKSKKQIENQSQTEYMQNNQPQIVSREEEKQNRIKTHSQSGRSMVEMLGVLAIIAILSIGGIVGYKLAMNYYQADQIANEINLMRNDLKVKYALGNEELLLGDPYDDTPENEDYSGHLSTQYDRYSVDYDCIRKDKAEFYNCRETDAYYIKVGNVSKGVCKPLTTLVNAMDGLMYIKINKQPYIEDDLCSSDEANEFYIQFDAEDVNGNYDSNRPEGWCAKDEDCEESQVCDEKNNTCVECVKNADCASNICRKDHTCGECTKDSDCLNPRPICNTESATCVGCAVDDECPDMNKPNCDTASGACCDDPLMTWNGSECVCPEDYKKSETSSGKAVCLPYCEQEVDVVLMVDQSSSLGWKNHDASQYSNDLYKENAQKIQKVISKLNIPDKLKAAVYLSGCYQDNYGCTGQCPVPEVPNPLSFGKHSAGEIKAALQIELEKAPLGACNWFINPLKDITQKICQTGKEKLIVVVFYDVDTADSPYFDTLKQKCPQSIIYNIAFEGHTFDAATKTYDLDQVLSNETTMQEYAEILNKEFKDHLCVERE